jgi:hypothetical protein
MGRMKFLFFLGVVVFTFALYNLIQELQQNREKEKRIKKLTENREKFYRMLERRKAK